MTRERFRVVMRTLSLVVALLWAGCGSTNGALDGAYCSDDTDCASGVCGPDYTCGAITDGGSCSRDEDCVSLACVDSTCGARSAGAE
jgi:hypothetical protein